MIRDVSAVAGIEAERAVGQAFLRLAGLPIRRCSERWRRNSAELCDIDRKSIAIARPNMIAAVDEVPKHRQKRGVPEIANRYPGAAWIRIPPVRYEQAGIPEQQPIFKAVAGDEIE